MQKLRGVNLGGWLVLERWITPSLFKDLQAADEMSFCLELGENKAGALDKHRREWITEADIAWIAERGLNALRIPVGHWIFGDAAPYVGAVEYLDWALDTAAKYKLHVLIDLHGVPGSQNGWDHSGTSGALTWPDKTSNIRRSVEIIERLAERYSGHSALWGIELLNEPRWDVPKEILVNYYEEGYAAVRRHCDDTVAVVMSDSFRPHAWEDVLIGPAFANVMLDSHLYQCFSEEDKQLDMAGHRAKTNGELATQIVEQQRTHPVIVGEWSAALDDQSLQGVDRQEAEKQFAAVQLDVFKHAAGWFYWTYKTEDTGAWNFHASVESGIVPNWKA